MNFQPHINVLHLKQSFPFCSFLQLQFCDFTTLCSTGKKWKHLLFCDGAHRKGFYTFLRTGT